MTGPVGGGTGTTHRLFAEIGHVAAKRALVNLAIVGTVERHAIVLELDDHFVGLLAHELDGILVTEPVGTLDGIVHVPRPVIFLGVTQRSRHTALRCNSVRAGRKNLGQHGRLQAGFGQLDRGTQTGATGTDDDRIKLQNRNTHAYSLQRIAAAHAV
ncbi:hypothetical protein SDC9_151688 [bioreactor metagenome]|uniref:Uncharacterized protein n=1 Tax=bioreactor metagenome TaxID=1076179 RepID=A0A645ESR4_9ZZZZ